MSIIDNSYKIKYEVFMLVSLSVMLFFSVINNINNVYPLLLLISILILSRYFGMFTYSNMFLQPSLQILSIVSCIFICYFSPVWFTFLILLISTKDIDFISGKIKVAIILFSPVITYTAFYYAGVVNKSLVKYILFSGLILIISLIYILIDKLAEKYNSYNEKLKEVLYKSAVTELNEKNLNRDLSMKNYLADRNARLEEREKISRNMHNVVGHTITSAIMALDASQVLINVSQDMALQKLDIANDRMRESLESIRQAVRVMDDTNIFISSNDFICMLLNSINEFVLDTEIKIRHNIEKTDNEYQIRNEHAQFLNGAMLELLSNGVRHGKAKAFIILLTVDSTHVKLSVADNGKLKEFNEEKFLNEGFGLKKIKKYLTECGGHFSIYYSDGFCADVELPII